MRVRGSGILLQLLLFCCLAAVFWGLGGPFAVDVVLFVVAVALSCLLPARQLALVVASLIVALGLTEVALHVMTRNNALATTYRMEDKYFEQGHYTPRVHDAMTQRFGDIAAMDPLAPAAVRESRHVRFETDDMGFRNDHDYRGEPFVLLGDSFVAGTDSDQADVLGNVLRARYGLPVYSLGFPGTPDDYLGYARRFLGEKSRDVRFVLFLFEGNDLSCSSKQRKKFDASVLSPYDRLKLRYAKAVRGIFTLPTTVFNMAEQVRRLYLADDDAVSETYKVGGRHVAFYGSYIDAALFPHCSFNFRAPDEDVLSRTAMVFFIPAKYRVYFDWLENPLGRELPRPASGFVSVRRYFAARGIPAYDLTPALTEAAGRELAAGRYVYWRDDTHWGPEGIRAAAAVVADKLREGPRPAPSRSEP